MREGGSMPDVQSLRFVVRKQDSGFRACWVDEVGKESEPFELELPLSEDDTGCTVP
jgi:hypothetical protein